MPSSARVVDDGVPPVYAIYARKSTKGKKKNKEGKDVERQERSIPDQVKACQDLAEEKKIKPAHIFREEKSARKSANREVFDEMMDDIRAGKYTGLICWHPDRLARNMKDAGELIDMLDRGILKDLKFPSYQFVNDANGLMTLGLQFLLAKLYSDNLSESVKRGNRGIISDGKAMGKKSLHGYKVVDKYQRKDGKNFTLIKQAFQMGLNKATQDEVAKYLNDHEHQRRQKDENECSESVRFIQGSVIYRYLYLWHQPCGPLQGRPSL